MAIKKLILLLIVLAVLVSGCLNSGDNKEQEEGDSGGSGGTQKYIKTYTPEEITTSGETETPTETETFKETKTPEETEIVKETEKYKETQTPSAAGEIEEEQTENMTVKGKEAQTGQYGETEPRTYLVRLREYVFIPSKLKINKGDMVVWRNFEDIIFTLTSEEGLFEDQRLGYGNTFNYTFNETGSYNFGASGYPNMQMTITVK